MGHLLDAHYYKLVADACPTVAAKPVICQNKNILTWGLEDFYALRTDSAGMPLWARHFDRHGGFRFLKELPGGDLLAGINMDTAGAAVARLTAQGDFIWCKSYVRPDGMIQDCLVLSDDEFIITGSTDSLSSTDPFEPTPTGYDPKLFLMKLNGMGDVQWCKGYSPSSWTWYPRRGSRIERTEDGNYVVLANLSYVGYDVSYRPLLMKLDGNGDTLWTRSAGQSDFRYEIYDLLIAADGGILYDGELVYSGTFLFKCDSLGHLPCSERPAPPITTVDLFPTDSSFTLSSVDGVQVFPAFNHDTIVDPMHSVDGCLFTLVTEPQAFEHKPTIRPNPNTGHFTVQFNDPLMAESYYSVYDTMGRLLYQRPLPQGAATEDVDLSRFGKGTYVIKFTEKVGTCYERVVVE